MFPDSGVPYTDARNSLANPSTANCNPLWYSTSRCKPRFDPAAANAELSELINLINKGEIAYNCASLNNLELAARYLIQRGLPRGGVMNGGPNNYSMNLDPTLTRYNNFLTLTVMPAIRNVNGGTYLDIDGHGFVPVLRNDSNQLEAGDFLANVPYIICYLNGAFYLCGLASSQVPIVVKGGINAWIRTDGNDITGDGTANTPDKAFKTIAGCWYATGSRFAATPSFSINMRLGIPGRYAGADIGPFGGRVSLTGDEDNPGAYIITQVGGPPDVWFNLWINGVSNFSLGGVTLVQEKSGLNDFPAMLRVLTNSGCVMYNCNFDLLVDNESPNGGIIQVLSGSFTSACSSFAKPVSNIIVNGNGHKIGIFVAMSMSASLEGASGLIPGLSSFYRLNDVKFTGNIMLMNALSAAHWGSCTDIISSNVTGVKYNVVENSTLNMGGRTSPGDLPGVAAYGGVFVP